MSAKRQAQSAKGSMIALCVGAGLILLAMLAPWISPYAPDAIDLNTASAEQLKKLGLDEETTTKVIAARPFSSLEDPKIKQAIPADVLTKLDGKINVKPPAQ